MNAIDQAGFASQERAWLEPPSLSARQEYVAGLYSELAHAEDEIARQMDKRAEALDKLRDMGEAV